MLIKNSLFLIFSIFVLFSRPDFSLMLLVELLFWNAGVSFLNDQSSPIKYNFITIIILYNYKYSFSPVI